MPERKEEIRNFVATLKQKYGNLPKFCHNLNAPDNKVYYSGPYFNDNEIVAAIDALLFGKWASSGEICAQFEREFSKAINNKYSFFTNSGSSANLLLIAACKEYFGWKDGDEIIVSAVGFPTTVSAIIQNGLKPVFTDIEWDTLNFKLSDVNDKVTEKTRAIFLSPVLGNPPDMDELFKIIGSQILNQSIMSTAPPTERIAPIKLLLDNCDSLGSKWKGKYLNEYAVASSCSFYPAHEITTLEGGMVSSNIEEIIKIARSYATWGRSCFPENTKVLTANGERDIQNVKVGDKVLTHIGKFKKVVSVLNRNYDGEIIDLKCSKNKSIVCTRSHEFLAIPSNGNSFGKIKNKTPVWIEAKNIKIGDYLLESPIKVFKNKITFSVSYKTSLENKNFKIKGEPDLMRLAGYWLAEGSLAKNDKSSNGRESKKYKRKIPYYKYRVDFSFHKDEKDYIKDVKSLMKKYFNVSCYEKLVNKSNGVSLQFNTRLGYEFFLQNFNKGAKNKQIPNKVLLLNNYFLSELIVGYWRGDGSAGVDNRKQSSLTFNFSSISYNLIEQVRKILLKLGVSASYCVRKTNSHKSSVVNKNIIKAQNDLFSLNVYGQNAKILNDLLLEKYSTTVNKKYHYFTEDNKYAIFKVNKIKKRRDSLKVYNLSVEQDNSYHANNLIVHNCWCVGVCNLLPNGNCNKRFSPWLEHFPDMIVDHKYVFNRVGYNLKPLDLQAAIGLEQLKKLEDIYRRRQTNLIDITSLFLKYIDVETVGKYPSVDWVPFGVPIICKSKQQKIRLVNYLEGNGIQTRNYFAGNLLMHKGYSHLDDYIKYPEANKVLDLVFFVGCAPTISDENIKHIEKVLKAYEG